MQQELVRSHNDIEIEREKLRMQAELERYKADLKAQTDLQIAQMQADRAEASRYWQGGQVDQ